MAQLFQGTFWRIAVEFPLRCTTSEDVNYASIFSRNVLRALFLRCCVSVMCVGRGSAVRNAIYAVVVCARVVYLCQLGRFPRQ